MGYLTREQILQAPDLPREVVAIPEWGGEVLVRGLTGAERAELEIPFLEGVGQNGKTPKVSGDKFKLLRERLVSMTVIGEDGERLFSETDVAALSKKSAVALQRVFDVGQRLSGMSQEDVEELSKN